MDLKKVWLADYAMVTALGSTLGENWQKLTAGEQASKAVDHFDTNRMEYHQAAVISDLWEKDYDNRVCELIRRAICQLMPPPPATHVIWAGIKGDVEFIESAFKKNTCYLPVHYRQFVENYLGLETHGFEVNAACASSAVGMALAAQKITSGEWSNALVCGADLVSRFTFMGFSALKALTPAVCRPFDERRDGLYLGEAAVAVLLSDEESALKSGHNLQAELTGWGISNDANHITGPARDGYGLIQAIQTALRISGLSSAEVEAFCAHGTGTPYNDGMELTAVETLFGERRFPIFSIKGAIGHTLGAAGGIEAIISALCLQNKAVPPTVGFEQGEERTVGRISAWPQKFAGSNILTTNSGFGGVNAALVLKAT